MSIIGLVGYAGSGKSTIARALAKIIRPRPVIMSFAGVLKEKVAEALDVPLDYIEANKPSIRPLLVEMGRTGRKVNPSMWIDYLDATRPRDMLTIIDDVRYLNEAAYITGRGGTVIYVGRTGVGPANDEEANSIGEVMDTEPLFILNSSTPEAAAAKIIELTKGATV